MSGQVAIEDGNCMIGYHTDTDARRFFSDLEARQRNVLPEYLKNLLFLNGFASKATFCSVKEEDFHAMEKMCQEEMPSFCPRTPEFFSYFASCTEHFKIPLGHRRLLLNCIQADLDTVSDKREPTGAYLRQQSIESCKAEPLDPLQCKELPHESQFPVTVLGLRQKIQSFFERNDMEHTIDADELDISIRYGENDVFGCVFCSQCDKEVRLSQDARRKRKNGMPVISVSNYVNHIKRNHYKNLRSRKSDAPDSDSNTSEDTLKRKRTKGENVSVKSEFEDD
ncbi:uncharacterized protein LOC132255587 [Phlebotomus argentipes]|uniref:uncharacterized protein LOC132255587 n=1 Tax=Phlebotomus argentipes TaxID=94469 RepID=UPI002892D242|nr:uncharacterized protein LOC132255587 [Phlebotomus argentipes]